MKPFRMRQRPWLVMLALVFAVQTAAAAMCIGMPAVHAAEMAAEHCHNMAATGMQMAAPMQMDMSSHACSHCDAPDLGAPDAPTAFTSPAMALLAIVALPQLEVMAAGAAPSADPEAHAPPDPLPLYLTTQRLRI